MRRDRGKHRLHVLGQHRALAVDQRPGLRGAQQALRGARRQSERQLQAACAPPTPARNRAARRPRAPRAPGSCRLSTSAPLSTAGVSFSSSRRSPCSNTRRSEAAIRIAQAHAHQEAIELRLRQAIGAELLMRILRGDHEERLGQRVGHAIDADLTLLHRLQQRALRFGAGAIDLIGQQQLGEHRAAAELEFVRVAIEDRYPDDVGRQHVAGELHPRPFQAQHPRQAVRQRGLADAGHVLDQQVTARQQAGQAQPHLPALAEDHALDAPPSAHRAGGSNAPPCGERAHLLDLPQQPGARALELGQARALLRDHVGAVRCCTKFSLASLARALASSCSIFCSRLSRRCNSLAGSISPAIGTSSVSSPTSAAAAGGARLSRRERAHAVEAGEAARAAR